MKQFIYNERVYSDLNSLYKENRESNLVTLENFKTNVNRGMSIKYALNTRDLTKNEKEARELFEDYSDSGLLFYSLFSVMCFMVIFKLTFFTEFLFSGLYGMLHNEDFFESFHFFIFGSIPYFALGYSIFRILKIFTPQGKIARKKYKELKDIIAQEHKEIEAKIQEELKLI